MKKKKPTRLIIGIILIIIGLIILAIVTDVKIKFFVGFILIWLEIIMYYPLNHLVF